MAKERAMIDLTPRRKSAKKETLGPRRKSVSGSGMGTIRDAVSKKPEVMYKVSGGALGSRHVKSHLEYITRNGQLEAIDNNGITVGKEDLKGLKTEWTDSLGKRREGGDKRKAKDTFNQVFSMPAGTPPELVLRAALKVAHNEKNFDGRKWVAVLHTDQKHPHVHLTVKSVSDIDGTRLRMNRNDLERVRSSFAEQLRGLGVDCVATPKHLRGVVKSSPKIGLLKAEKEGRGINAQRRLEEIQQELRGGRPSLNPYAEQILQQQRLVRAEFLELAKQLGKSTDKSDHKLAVEIVNHLKSLPKTLIDERESLRRQVVATEQTKGQGRGVDQVKKTMPDRSDEIER